MKSTNLPCFQLKTMRNNAKWMEHDARTIQNGLTMTWLRRGAINYNHPFYNNYDCITLTPNYRFSFLIHVISNFFMRSWHLLFAVDVEPRDVTLLSFAERFRRAILKLRWVISKSLSEISKSLSEIARRNSVWVWCLILCLFFYRNRSKSSESNTQSPLEIVQNRITPLRNGL